MFTSTAKTVKIVWQTPGQDSIDSLAGPPAGQTYGLLVKSLLRWKISLPCTGKILPQDTIFIATIRVLFLLLQPLNHQ